MPRWQRQGSRWVSQPRTTTTTLHGIAPAPRALPGDGNALGTPTTPPRNAGAMANAPADSPPAPPPAPLPARRYATRNVSPDASSGVQADPEGPQGAARLDENMSLSRAIARRARLPSPRDEDQDVESLRRRTATLLSDDELRQVLRSNGNDVLASVLEIGGSVENLHQRQAGGWEVLGGADSRELQYTNTFLASDYPRVRQPFFPVARVPDPVAKPVTEMHGLVCKYIDHLAAKDIPDSDKAPSEFTCPLSLHAMLDPVRCSDGKVYDCAHIEAWRQSPSFNGTSPLTRAELSPDQTECTALVNEMAEWACGNLGITGDDRDALAAALKEGLWVAEPKEAGAKPDADVNMEANGNFTSQLHLRVFGGMPPPSWVNALRPVVHAQVGNGVTEDEINNMLLVTDGDAIMAISRLRGLARARWMRNADRPPPNSEAVNQIPEHDLPRYVDGAEYVGTRGAVHLYWSVGVRVQPLPPAPPRSADNDGLLSEEAMHIVNATQGNLFASLLRRAEADVERMYAEQSEGMEEVD